MSGIPRPPARRRYRRWATGWTWLGVLLVAVYCLFPFYWMVVSSLEPPNAVFSDLWPSQFTLENFRSVFAPGSDFAYGLRNSAVVAGSSTVLAMLIGTLAAYALTRLRFQGKFVVLGTILAASMFPGVALLPSLFQLFTDLRWIDRYQAMVVPNISFTLPLAIWILTSFFTKMPWELEEVARVDGCTPRQAFRLVIMPLAAPAIFTTAILVFITAWNEYLIASNVSLTPRSQTVTAMIGLFPGTFGTQMAAGVVVTLPVVVLVLLFQRRIVAGLTAGSIKD
jgi:multiple sugar transport system permease protein